MRTEIFIDFDGTITDPTYGTSLPPQDGCVDTINRLYDSGNFEIIIYSCRSNPDICSPSQNKFLSSDATHLEKKWAAESAEEEMIEYLKTTGIKFHRVVPNKPHYHIIIDDRAINPSQGWSNIGDKINESISSN